MVHIIYRVKGELLMSVILVVCHKRVLKSVSYPKIVKKYISFDSTEHSLQCLHVTPIKLYMISLES